MYRIFTLIHYRRLFFGGRVLDDLSEKLYTYNIDNGTVIILQERKLQQVEKYVRISS